MSEQNRLPIEDDQELLAEYGRAFAWINAIEYFLGEFIDFKGKLNLLNKDLRDKLMNGKALGAKIELARSLVPPDLLNNLTSLNEKRIMLAHSVIGEEVDPANPGQKTGKYVIEHKKRKQYLTREFITEVIMLAQHSGAQIHQELLRGTKFEKRF